MLPQYVITLGARTKGGRVAGKIGKFDEDAYKTMENIVRKERGFQV